MATDLATLALVVDSTQAERAAGSLDNLVGAAGRAEGAVERVGTASAGAGAAAAKLAKDCEYAQRMIAGMGAVGSGAWANLQASQQMIAGMGTSTSQAVAGMQRMSSQSQMTSRDMGMMAFQLQDVFVTAAMGMSPMMIALQQGTQLIQPFLMTNMKLGDSLRAMGPMILSFFTNPLMLAVLAAGALGTALVGAFSWLTGSGGKSVEDRLSRHKQLLSDIAESYGAMENAAVKYGTESTRVLQFQAGREAEALQKSMSRGAMDALAGGVRRPASPLAMLLPDRWMANVGAFDPRRVGEEGAAAMERLRDEARNGRPDILAFREALVSALADPEITRGQRSILRSVMDATDALAKQQIQLEGIIDANQRLRDAWKDQSQILRDIAGPTPMSPRQAAEQAFSARMTRSRDLAIGSVGPNGMISENAVAGAAMAAQQEYARALAQIARDEEALRQEYELGMSAIGARSAAQREALAIEREMIAARRDGLVTAEEELAAARAGALVRAQAEAAVNEARDSRMRSMQQQVTQGQLELALIGATAEEAARLRTEYQLIAQANEAARASGGIVSQEELDLIRQTAQETGVLARRTAELNLLRDTAFAREQMGRTGSEQRIMSTLRSAGVDPASEVGQAYAESERINEQLRTMRGLAEGVWKGFIADIRAGTSMAETMANALNRIADRLLDMATDQVFSSIFAPRPGATGGGGGLGGWLGSLFAQPSVPPGGSAAGIVGGMVQRPGPAVPVGAVTGRDLAPLGDVVTIGSGAVGAGARGAGSAMLDLIARSEGTADRPGGGYNTSLDYGRWLPGGREHNLTGMTLDQIAELQAGMRTPANRALYPGGGSSALGRYQITGRTMMGLRGQMGLSGSELFDPQTQDAMALQLLQNRQGQGIGGLRNEWAGLQNVPSADITAALAEAQTTATVFSTQFDTTLTTLASEMGQSASGFHMQWGSALSALLAALMKGGGGLGGGTGGFLGAIFGGGASVASSSVSGSPAGLSAGRGSGVSFTVVDQRSGGAKIEQRQSRGPNGEVMIRAIVRDEVGRGGVDKAMGARYGVRPSTVSRG